MPTKTKNKPSSRKSTANLHGLPRESNIQKKPVLTHVDLTDETRRITSSQEGLTTQYSSSPNLAKAIYFREHAENAKANNAKNLWSFTMKIGGQAYVVNAHDGDPFPSQMSIVSALQPNTSTGGKGANGCGGMLSPLLIVKNQSRYHHLILSKDGASTHLIESHLDDGTPRISVADDDLIDNIRKRLGSLWGKINVAYLSRFDVKLGKSECFLNVQTLMLLKDFCPNLIGRDFKVFYHYSLVLEEGDVYDDRMKISSVRPSEMMSCDHFDEILFRHKWTIPANDCKINYDAEEIRLNAEVELTLYDGLVRGEVGLNANRRALIRTNGDSPGHALMVASRPEFNTFVSFDYQQSRRFSRLNEQPVFAGKMLEKFAMAFNVGLSDNSETFTDFDNFPQLREIINATNSKNNFIFRRNPFARIRVRITEILSVDGKAVDQNDHARLRQYLGNVDEMFCVSNRNHLMRCVTDIFQTAADDPENAEGITDIRNEIDLMWPRRLDGMAELPIFSKTKINRLMLVDPKTNKSIVKIGPGGEVRGVLTHADTGEVVDATWSFEPVGDGDNTLISLGKSGQWYLSVGDYHIQTNDGEYVKVDEDTWLKEGVRKNTLPHIHLHFRHGDDLYRLNTKVDLPQRFTNSTGGSGGSGGDPGEAKSKRGVSMFHASSPHGRYVSFSNNTVKLNINNQLVRILFADIKTSKAPREKLWARIQDEAQLFSNEMKLNMCHNWQRSKNGTGNVSEWNDDVDGYALNVHMGAVFRSKEAVELLKTNSRILGQVCNADVD